MGYTKALLFIHYQDLLKHVRDRPGSKRYLTSLLYL